MDMSLPFLDASMQQPGVSAFRQVFRRTAGGVWVVTAAHAGQRSGLTATSIVSLSADPAELMFSMQPNASSFPLVQASGRFGVNLLAQSQQAIADRFAGRDGCRGEARYADATWRRTPDGVWLLEDACAALACEVSQIVWRRNSTLVIGRVTAMHLTHAAGPPLVYADGRYAGLTTLSD